MSGKWPNGWKRGPARSERQAEGVAGSLRETPGGLARKRGPRHENVGTNGEGVLVSRRGKLTA